MPKADLYKISINDGKVLLRIPQQLVGAELANMDDIQAELHLMGVDYVPEQLQEIYERTSGDFDFLTDFKQLNYIRRVSLDSLDSHIVVHSLFHESCISEILTFFRNQECVKSFQIGQMVEDISLIVTQITNWVIAIVLILKIAESKAGQTIKI